MGTPEQVAAAPAFELASLPEPMAVRDPNTGNVVDGYRVTVRSTKTGATAQLDVPASLYSPAYLKQAATAALAPLDATIEAFGSAQLNASTPGATT